MLHVLWVYVCVALLRVCSWFCGELVLSCRLILLDLMALRGSCFVLIWYVSFSLCVCSVRWLRRFGRFCLV